MTYLHGSERESSRRMVVLRYFVMGATTLVLSCEVLPTILFEAEVSCTASSGGTNDADNDPDGDKNVECAVGDTTATANLTSSGIDAVAIASGSEGGVASWQRSCWRVTEASQIDVSRLFNVRFERYCPGSAGSGTIDLTLSLSRNRGAKVKVAEGGASFGCDDTEINNQGGFVSCDLSIPSRGGCATSDFVTNVLQTELGDSVEMDLWVNVQSALTSGSEFDEPIVVDASINAYLSGALVQEKCPSPLDCTTNADCTLPSLCLDFSCGPLTFATGAKPSFFTAPAPLTSGATFSLAASANQTTGDLLPYEIVAGIDAAAFDFNGPLTAGQTLGACSLDPGGFSRPIVVGSTPGTFYVDLGLNGTQDATDPVVVGAENGSRYEATVTIPQIARWTIPASSKVICSLNSLFIAGADGIYPIDVDAKSIDPDTGGEDDNAGRDPLTFHRQLRLFIGDVGPTTTTTSSTTTTTTTITVTTTTSTSTSTSSSSSTSLTTTTTTVPVIAACGDPVAFTAGDFGGGDAQVTAGDALFVLRSAVGSETCADCVCDVDSSGSVAASDALLTLKKAVGQAVVLTCPACD